MVWSGLQKIMLLSGFGIALVLFSGVSSFADIQFDTEAIDAEIVAAVAEGAEPGIAAQSAVANAVRDIVEENPDYPGGPQALNRAILDTLATLKVTGMDTVDILVAGNYALGLQQDTAIEAYERGIGWRIIRARKIIAIKRWWYHKCHPGSPT